MKSARLEITLRLVLFGFVALFGMAVVAARMEPEPLGIRVTGLDRPTPISSKLAGVGNSGFSLLTDSSSRVEYRQLPNGEFLDHSSVSPWRDEEGNWQLVGCWTEWKGPEQDRVLIGSGLMRLSYPDGKTLDKIETGKVPTSPPAWVPGPSAKVAFAGLNGQLYLHDFDGPYAKSAPVQVAWEVPGLTEGEVQIKDVCWPNHPQFTSRLVVSLSHFGKRANGTRYYSPSELWWVELDDAGATAIAAGRVTPEPASEIKERWERNEFSPVVHVTESGEVLLAYLTRMESEPVWRLHCSALEFDESGRGIGPRAGFSRGVLLDTRSRPDPPVFNEDGLGVTCPLVSAAGKKLELVRKPMEVFKNLSRKRLRKALATLIEASQPRG